MSDLETMEIAFNRNSPLPVGEVISTVTAGRGVVERAQNCLRASTYWAIRHLACEHHEGMLVIRGQVSSYYQKQLAQELVRGLRGVEVIRNAVDVV